MIFGFFVREVVLVEKRPLSLSLVLVRSRHWSAVVICFVIPHAKARSLLFHDGGIRVVQQRIVFILVFLLMLVGGLWN